MNYQIYEIVTTYQANGGYKLHNAVYTIKILSTVV